jgi:spore germination cell wall hydrolase CwlJ-like protein
LGEARGQTLEGKIAVANVVMNRVLNKRAFANTIKDVVTAPGQFCRVYIDESQFGVRLRGEMGA